MLLYSVLHLAGVRRVDDDYAVAGRAGRLAARDRTFRQLHSRTPGTPSTAGPRGSRRRPGRSARASPPRSGWRSPRSGRASSSAARSLRLRRLHAGRRRLPDGGRLARSRLARRAPEARQPLLALRQQPHHDRRQNRTGLRRRHPHPLRGLRLERAAGRRRQRPLAARPRSRSSGTQPTGRRYRRRQPHRLRLAEQGRHRGCPRRAARRGRGEAD